MPSIRPVARGVSGVVLLALAFAGVTAAQSPNPNAGLDVGLRIGLQFGAALLVNLVLGGALVALGPEYAADTVARIRDDAAEAFLWGLLAGIGLPIALVIVALTIIGLVVAIPGFFGLIVLGIVGQAVTIAWVGSAVVETGPDGRVRGKAVVVGAVVLAVVAAIPVLGRLATTFVGFFGLGVVARGVYESWRGDGDPA